MRSRPSLGGFLRSRREGTAPAQVGIVHRGRRRTPGLRREELALLAGISVDYLVRLEQDREQRPSASVLAALSEAMKLSDLERARFLRLAAIAGQREMCPSTPRAEPLSMSTLALLERLEPTPAAVLSHAADVVVWNQAYDRLMRPSGLLDSEPPNLARYLFLGPAAPAFHPDRQDLARVLVSQMQDAAASCWVDDAFEALVAQLRADSPEFNHLWARQEVLDAGRRRERVVHPDVGDLEFHVEALALPDRALRLLLTYVGADDDTSAALDELHASAKSSGHLRAV